MFRNGTPVPRAYSRPGETRFLRAGAKARILLAAACLGIVGGSPVAGDTVSIEHAPVFLLFGAAPNFLLTVDTSRSMNVGYLPDDIWAGADAPSDPELDRRDAASAANAQYYDPAVTYLPPLLADGTSLPHADFNNAAADAIMSALACSAGCTDERITKAWKSQSSPAPKCSDWCARTSCILDLEHRYAPQWSLAVLNGEACLDIASATRRSNLGIVYSIDPAHPKLSAFLEAAKLNSISNATDLGRAWAWRCMRDPSANDCPAFYYRFNPAAYYDDADSASGTKLSCKDLDPAATAPKNVPRACLEHVVVGSSDDLAKIYKYDKKTNAWIDFTQEALADRSEKLKDADGTTPGDLSLAKRNFANWFSYYRHRMLMVQSALSHAVKDLPERVRVGYQDVAIAAQYTAGTDGYTRLATSFGPFDSAARQSFYDWLYARRATNNSTGLISAALRAHEFCRSPQAYQERPRDVTPPGNESDTSNAVVACRNNFHLLFTDGVWDDTLSRVSGPLRVVPPVDLANNDGTAKSLPAEDQRLYAQQMGVSAYDPTQGYANVFHDSNTGMLADVVFRSWITDLRPTNGVESGRVATLIKYPNGTPEEVFWNPGNDPADWQHLTTYTVGFGVSGNVSYPSGSWTYTLPSKQQVTTNIQDSGFPGSINAIRVQGGSAPTIPVSFKLDDNWHAGINGRGGYLSARDPANLTARFAEVVDVVATIGGNSSAAAAAVNTGAASGSDLVFQARMDTSDWSGDVRSFQVADGNGSPCTGRAGTLCQDPSAGAYNKSAAAVMTPGTGERRIFTAAGSAGIVFGSAHWNELTVTERLGLLRGAGYTGSDPDAAGASIEEAKARMDYVAGDDTYESDGATYRFRTRAEKRRLGDFINAGPVLVGKPSFYYAAAGYSSAAEGKQSFKTKYADRPEIVFAGGNDGILHAFDADELTEVYGFVPPALFGLDRDKRPAPNQTRLDLLSDVAYGGNVLKHRPFVDGPIAVGDVSFGDSKAGDASAWHSVLVAGLGLGAQAVYGLDVTEVPGKDASTSSFADKKFLWQIGDRDDSAVADEEWDPDLGYVFARPAIVRIRGASASSEPVWVAIFGNGYNSSEDDGSRPLGCNDASKDADPMTTCGQAVLFVVDIAKGKIIGKYRTGVGRKDDPRYPNASDADKRRPNALGQATVVAATRDPDDGDLVADFAYATDLFGNVWRFDLSNLGSTPVKLFSAVDVSGNPQPITSSVAVGRHPSGVGTMVLFGTGQYLNKDDVSDRQVQTFYGIWDKGETTAGPHVTRQDLLVQKFLATDIVKKAQDGSVVSRGRTSTATGDAEVVIPKGETLGWLIDFDIEKEGSANKGERVVNEPEVQGNRVLFVSLVPETNACAGGGYSWVNALDLRDGSRLGITPFDYNLDGSFGDADLLTGGNMAGTSARLTPGGSSTGVYTSPSSMGVGVGRVSALVSTSSADVIQIDMSTLESWRVWQQLQ